MNTACEPMYAWQDLPWRKIERAVFKLQHRIYQASRRGDIKLVHNLQRLLLKSWYAKLLATRRVTQDNRGKRTAGVDGVKALTPPQRLMLARRLHLSGQAAPVRRVWIAKPGSAEKRPLGIPVMSDRAGQALVKLALEPEWEAKFEPNSYGFRPGRSCHDAIDAIHARISQQEQYILDADIEKCFDRLNHQALLAKLQTFPTLRQTIKGWLKAGVMDGEELFPTETGAPQGAVLSPLLMNVALHGLETAITTAFPPFKGSLRWQPKVVRVADDFVVLHRDPEVIGQAKTIAATWLQGMGLALKPSKTRIGHTLHPVEGTPGCDFLGFHIRQYPVGKSKTGTTGHGTPLGFKTHIKPSPSAQRTHLRQLKHEVRTFRGASQEVLITRLNPLIRGWSHYYSTVVAKATFARMDTLLYAKLRRWAARRHPTKSAWWVSEKYWHCREGRWSFKTDTGLTLRRHADTPIRRHTKVTGTRSPYDGDWVYWATRLGRHPTLSPRWAFLLRRQQGRCSWCGLYFKPGDDLVELDHILPRSQGGDARSTNLQLLHGHCHDDKTAQDRTGSGPRDKSHISEEPYDANVSRTVLKPSREG
jgi:RNA-directed DNA polymerase